MAANPQPYLQLEQQLRQQLHEACRLARQLHERLSSIPEGKLLLPATTSSSSFELLKAREAVHELTSSSIAMAAAEVVGAFNEAVKLLLRSSVTAATLVWDRSPTFSETFIRAESPNVAAKEADSAPEQSKVPAAGSSCCLAMAAITDKQKRQPPAASDAMNVCATSSSPPHSIMNSPLQSANTSENVSPGSPAQCKRAQPPQLATHHLSADDTAITDANEAAIGTAVFCRKRKLLPKITLRMAASSAESANSNTPPDDGHSWRKYGQKVIHGALYPRGYYRCAHKTESGCQAVKQVQRCDEEEMLFDVTYKGYHTCTIPRSAAVNIELVDDHNRYWPLAFPQTSGALSTLISLPNAAGFSSTQGLSKLLAGLSNRSDAHALDAAPASFGSILSGLRGGGGGFFQEGSTAPLAAEQLCDLAALLPALPVARCIGDGQVARVDHLTKSGVRPDLSSRGGAGLVAGCGGTLAVGEEVRRRQQHAEDDDDDDVGDGEGRLFTPLEDWTSSCFLQMGNRAAAADVFRKRPFTKPPYRNSTAVAVPSGEVHMEIPDQALQLESKRASSTGIQMKAADIHEQDIAATMASSISPSASNLTGDRCLQADGQHQPFGRGPLSAASSPAAFDYLDNDLVFADCFKNLG